MNNKLRNLIAEAVVSLSQTGQDVTLAADLKAALEAPPRMFDPLEVAVEALSRVDTHRNALAAEVACLTTERDALREELDSIKASVEGYESPEHAAQVADTLGHANTALQQRLTVAEQALGGMLFAFDDGVGREWSAPLLDFARTITPAAEFVAALKPAKEGEGS